MVLDNKDSQREDVFDSLQGASSLTLLKKISIAAVAIALVAFFLFWSQSSSQDEKVDPQDTSGKALATRIVTLEDEVMKLKEEMKRLNIGQATADATSEPTLKQMSPTTQDPQATQTQPETINLKSLFEEELKASSANKEPVPEEPSTPVRDTVKPHVAKASANPSQTASKSTVYIVKKGDTLSKISLKFYGSAHKWKRIVDANKATLGNNNTLKIGMKLSIPQDE